MNELIELYNRDGFKLVMTTVAAGRMGSSYEIHNADRKKMLQKLGFRIEDVHFVSQIHSRIVIDISEWQAEPLTKADGMISGQKTDHLAVTVADCMPVYLHDRLNDVRALLHSGWKGTGIALNALELMGKKYGSCPADITAVLGPGIGSCCYNVDDERADVFAAQWGSQSVIERDGRKFLSLKNANRSMLEKAGITEIKSSDLCTCCDAGLGSYRREGAESFSPMFVLSYLNEL